MTHFVLILPKHFYKLGGPNVQFYEPVGTTLIQSTTGTHSDHHFIAEPAGAAPQQSTLGPAKTSGLQEHGS